MRAFQISQFGLENLRLVDLPTPACGAGMVLIRVHATSLNYRDLLMVRGHYDAKLQMPRIPLSDGAGEVVAVGAGVTQARRPRRRTFSAELAGRRSLASQIARRAGRRY